MRLSEDRIKAGILHPDRDVRDAAVMYFSRSACRDTSVLPVVIQAIEKYGWEGAFLVPTAVEGLPLSEETLPWVLGQLRQTELLKDRTILGRGWHGALASFLWKADAKLLVRHKAEIFSLPGLPKNDRDYMDMRIDLLTVDAETCWRELEAICHQASENQDDPDTEYGYSLVEAIARFGETEKVLSILPQKVEDAWDYGKGWMEQFMVSLAGEMRLDAAVPHIVAKLREAAEEADLLFEEGRDALVEIGTNAAVEGAATLFRNEDWPRCASGCHVLQHVHSDLAVAKTLELLAREDDVTVKAWLAQVLASQFAYEGVEPVRQVILGGDYEEDEAMDLRLDLIVAASLMEVALPEKEQWQAEVEKNREKREKKVRFYAEPDEDEEEPPLPPLKKKESPLLPSKKEEPPPPKEKIGRNDPCPCGSGKKFKKCCIKKYGNDLLD